eukprot:6207260-Pyramimonas_sp.AAC.1
MPRETSLEILVDRPFDGIQRVPHETLPVRKPNLARVNLQCFNVLAVGHTYKTSVVKTRVVTRNTLVMIHSLIS